MPDNNNSNINKGISTPNSNKTNVPSNQNGVIPNKQNTNLNQNNISPSGQNLINNKKTASVNSVKGASNKAAKATKNVGKGMKVAGKTAKAVGKGAKAVGKGIKSASNAAGTALSAIPGIGTALGAGVKAAGTAAGTAAQAGGTAANLAGAAATTAGGAAQKAGEKVEKVTKKASIEASSEETKKDVKKMAMFLKFIIGTFVFIIANFPVFFLLFLLAGIGIDATDGDSNWYNTDWITDELSSEFYSNICKGNIKKNVLDLLGKPVDVSANVSFSDKYSFGTVDGLKHNGLDLNANTTGNKEGDNVYSIYSDGEVINSTTDNSYPDSSVIGGWVDIKYEISTDDNSNYSITVTYGGLDRLSLNLKKGDKVSKGQVIGQIGDKEDSDTDIPSLHFGIYTSSSKEYLDPSNLFIQCSEIGLRGSSNEEIIWNYFLDYGYTKEGIAGIMANWYKESGFEPGVVQGDIPITNFSREYNNKLNTGQISKSEFMNNGPNGGGYGLAQWTWPDTKGLMYDFWKESGFKIDDLEFQLSWFIHDMETNSELTNLQSYLKTTADMNDAVRQFHNTYEKSATGAEERVQYASIFYDKYKNNQKQIYVSSIGGNNSKIETYLNELIKMANDQTIGYNLNGGYRELSQEHHNVDCASFVYFGLKAAGLADEMTPPDVPGLEDLIFNVPNSPFIQLPYDKSILQRGDIIVERNKHVTTYLGDGMEVAAHGCKYSEYHPNRSCEDGDQGDEVSYNEYSDSSNNYEHIYRLR